jgi:hypothetical protein
MATKIKSFFCLQALVMGFSAYVNALPAQIVIIPNAEELPSGALSLTGQERAQALAPYLTQTLALIGPGPYQVLFACKPNAVAPNIGSMQTLAPLSFTLGLPVHTPYGLGDERAMANLLLNDRRYDGLNIMIAWEQSAVGTLINQLGYDITPATSNSMTFVLAYPKTSNTPVSTTYTLGL